MVTVLSALQHFKGINLTINLELELICFKLQWYLAKTRDQFVDCLSPMHKA